jgi:hypothetical protein
MKQQNGNLEERKWKGKDMLQYTEILGQDLFMEEDEFFISFHEWQILSVMWDSWTIKQRGEMYRIWAGYNSSDTEWTDLGAICQFITTRCSDKQV